MIYAELEYEGSYDDVHDELVSLLKENFTAVESGHQGDSWIWVLDGVEKVAIDTFTSMKHRVKSDVPGPHVQRVLDVLERRFRLRIKHPPEPEGHESV